MIKKADKLVEATMLALQGKLELKENRKSRKTKKAEGIDVNVEDKTTVSVEGNETIVDTEDATVIVSKKEDEFVPETSDDLPIEAPVEEPVVDAPVAPDEDIVEVPADDTVMPEEVVDEPVDTELPTEESKKIENKKLQEWIEDEYDLKQFLAYEIKNKRPALEDEIDVSNFEDNEIVNKVYDEISGIIDYQLDQALYKIVDGLEESKKVESVEIEVSDDGKEVEVTTDNGEEVEVKDETPDENEEGETEIPADDEPSIDEMIEESKKVEDTESDLSAEGSGRKSFYGKAKVVKKDNGDEELYSYGTHVGGIRGGKPYSKGKFSTTTSSHQNAFFKQRGIDPKKVGVEEDKKIENANEKSNLSDIANYIKDIVGYGITITPTGKGFSSYDVNFLNNDDSVMYSVMVNNDAIKDKVRLLNTLILELKRLYSGKTFADIIRENLLNELNRIHPKKVDVEEGKQADQNEQDIRNKKSRCINCENKQRSAKVQEMIARRQKKSEALNSLNKTVKRHRAVLEHKKVQEANNDLGINEEVPKKEEPVPNTAEANLKVENKFSSKSFNEALTKYYKDRILAVESVEVTKLSKTRTGLKLEANLLSKSGKLKRAICLEMKQIQTGKSFDKYEVIETKGLVKENKENNNKVTMTTFTNKQNIIECRYILSK